jgi:transcriptional regulator with XRE-family HTH domain
MVSIMIMPSGKQPVPGPLARVFSAHVRRVIERDGVTHEALAKAMGVSRTYLSKRLRDDMQFTLNDVEAISLAFGLDLPKL